MMARIPAITTHHCALRALSASRRSRDHWNPEPGDETPAEQWLARASMAQARPHRPTRDRRLRMPSLDGPPSYPIFALQADRSTEVTELHEVDAVSSPGRSRKRGCENEHGPASLMTTATFCLWVCARAGVVVRRRPHFPPAPHDVRLDPDVFAAGRDRPFLERQSSIGSHRRAMLFCRRALRERSPSALRQPAVGRGGGARR